MYTFYFSSPLSISGQSRRVCLLLRRAAALHNVHAYSSGVRQYTKKGIKKWRRKGSQYQRIPCMFFFQSLLLKISSFHSTSFLFHLQQWSRNAVNQARILGKSKNLSILSTYELKYLLLKVTSFHTFVCLMESNINKMN